MDNTEIFLDKYKELENAAINEFKLPPDGSAGGRLPSWKNGVNSRISGLN